MRGDCQRAFAEAASEDGILLSAQSLPWICQRGHLALPASTSEAKEALERIYIGLGGEIEALATARSTRLTGDFFHEPTQTLIEIDESQHFTSSRLTSLDLYPRDTLLGFDLEHYKKLCRSWRVTSDGYYRAKSARGFGSAGRQRQRAYYDALRDLSAPAMGLSPLVRIDAPHRDGRRAYLTHRARLLSLFA